MKKPQYIAIIISLVLVTSIYVFGRTVPNKKPVVVAEHAEGDGHNHEKAPSVSIDSILINAKKQLNNEQVTRLAMLENGITRGTVKDQQLKAYHQLSHFWGDSMHYFLPYAYYLGEASRLENSEKSLTFAARLFLDNLQAEQEPGVRQWAALQAEDLFQRSLKINPDNDSSKTGLGATYLFGGITSNPMQGLSMIREVVTKDSTNVYAQLTLAKASVMSGQLDRAIGRLETVNKLQPENLEAILMLADVFERMQNKESAIVWYQKAIKFAPSAQLKTEIEKRIEDLKK